MYKQEKINPFADNLYRYLNFDQIVGFEDEGRVISKEKPLWYNVIRVSSLWTHLLYQTK
jgi:hypothetical protein